MVTYENGKDGEKQQARSAWGAAGKGLPILESRRAGGFTRGELVVGMALLGLLASLVIPMANQRRQRAQGAACMSNVNGLTQAWLLYAADHGGRAPPNHANLLPGSWVEGVEDWKPVVDNTNLGRLSGSLLAPYAGKDLRVWHCPSDRSAAPGQGPRVRSYAMNNLVGAGDFVKVMVPFDPGGGDVEVIGDGPEILAPDLWEQPGRLAAFTRPAKTMVLLDVHPDSLGDWQFRLPEGETWVSLPASYHDRSGNLGYADGHVAAHKWVSASTLAPVRRQTMTNMNLTAPAHDQQDLQWLADRMKPW